MIRTCNEQSVAKGREGFINEKIKTDVQDKERQLQKWKILIKITNNKKHSDYDEKY